MLQKSCFPHTLWRLQIITSPQFDFPLPYFSLFSIPNRCLSHNHRGRENNIWPRAAAVTIITHSVTPEFDYFFTTFAQSSHLRSLSVTLTDWVVSPSDSLTMDIKACTTYCLPVFLLNKIIFHKSNLLKHYTHKHKKCCFLTAAYKVFLCLETVVEVVEWIHKAIVNVGLDLGTKTTWFGSSWPLSTNCYHT